MTTSWKLERHKVSPIWIKCVEVHTEGEERIFFYQNVLLLPALIWSDN